jgi:hypothetical protein
MKRRTDGSSSLLSGCGGGAAGAVSARGAAPGKKPGRNTCSAELAIAVAFIAGASGKRPLRASYHPMS